MRLGILGGGQLARMMVPPAHRLGIEVWTLEREVACPAVRAGAQEVVGDWSDLATVLKFAETVDVLTLDHEFTPASILQAVEERGTPVRPGSATLSCIGDKYGQKRRLAEFGLPVAESCLATELPRPGWGWPIVLKTRRCGYDGKGNQTLNSLDGIELSDEFYAERFVKFQREIAVMVARDLNGKTLAYPMVETVQKDHICVEVRLSDQDLNPRAQELAVRAAKAVEAVGVLGVEIFEMSNGELVVNELAPRPHNSGHYTLDACVTSQFENHVRAVTGLPLGSTEPTVPAAVMVNLLGDGHGGRRPFGIEKALESDRVALHLYDKISKPGRKVGHLTATGATLEEAAEQAERAAAALHFAERTPV